jgi:hypothetical protein
MAVFWDVAPRNLVNIDVSNELTASIIRARRLITYHPDKSSRITLITEAESSSETSVNIYQTVWSNVPEDSHIHSMRQRVPNFFACETLFQTEIFSGTPTDSGKPKNSEINMFQCPSFL